MKKARGLKKPERRLRAAIEGGNALKRVRIGRWALLAVCCLFVTACGNDIQAPTALAVPVVRATDTVTAPAPSATDTNTPAPTATPLPTETPTPTSTPTPLPGASLIAFESNRDGNGEIYLLDIETGEQTNLTRNPAEDRAPAWRPDGGALAFQSNRDGNWEIYVLYLDDGHLLRVTGDPDYDGAPAWSPDGQSLAWESYFGGDLEIWVQAIAGGESRQLTDNDAGDYGPAWSPDGQEIAFTSWRDGNKEIYAVPAAGGDVRNLTQNPADDEDPAWGPDGQAIAFVSWRNEDKKTGNRDAEIYTIPAAGGAATRLTKNEWADQDPAWDANGRLVWAAYDPGPVFETYDPYRPGDYHLYRQAAARGAERLTETDWDDRRPAPAPPRVAPLAPALAALPTTTPQPTTVPTATRADGGWEVVQVPSVLAAGAPVLANELVVPSLLGWQQAVQAASGYDFLHTTLGTWRGIGQVRLRKMYVYDYGYLSWHKTGRAIDLALEYKVGGADQLVKVRDDQGSTTRWRLYLRAAQQDGSMGEPLKDNPWQFWWHIVPAEDPKSYDAGGRRVKIPAGYYVDVTEIAKRYGWERISSYAIEGDYHWRVDSNGTEYWHYERTDGLVWWDSMRQIYPLEELNKVVGWQACQKKAQSLEMIRCKGIPEP